MTAPLLIGIMMFAIAVPLLAYISFKLRGLSRARRARVVMVPVLLLAAFYVTAGASVGIHAWWIVPVGIFGAALLELVTLRIVERRLDPQRSTG